MTLVVALGGNALIRPGDRGTAVPSPAPREIVELGAVQALLAAGAIPVACGGGGIPVSSRNGKWKGIDAVIDKDRASALLAKRLGAERLLIGEALAGRAGTRIGP